MDQQGMKHALLFAGGPCLISDTIWFSDHKTEVITLHHWMWPKRTKKQFRGSWLSSKTFACMCSYHLISKLLPDLTIEHGVPWTWVVLMYHLGMPHKMYVYVCSEYWYCISIYLIIQFHRDSSRVWSLPTHDSWITIGYGYTGP